MPNRGKNSHVYARSLSGKELARWYSKLDMIMDRLPDPNYVAKPLVERGFLSVAEINKSTDKVITNDFNRLSCNFITEFHNIHVNH